MASVSSILRRLAREDLARAAAVRNVDVSHDGHPSDPCTEEALPVRHEIGKGLGMAEDAARDGASRSLVALALRAFEGSRIVAFHEAQAVYLREKKGPLC